MEIATLIFGIVIMGFCTIVIMIEDSVQEHRSKNNKKKGINIIDFTSQYWGHDFVVENQTGKIVSAHGWYSAPFVLEKTENNNRLEKGAIVVKKSKNGGYWYGRVKQIEWENDPGDMFFCKCKTILNDHDLNESEYNYILNKYVRAEAD